MSKNSVTFVTSYLKIYDEDYDVSRTFEKRLELFLNILDTGLNICIFISPEYQDTFKDLSLKYENLKIIDIISIDNSIFNEISNNYKDFYELPNNRNNLKDTKNYMILMNAKVEQVKKVIDINPFSSDYFAWFDFSLPHIFKNMNETINHLKYLSEYNYTKTFLAMPGCWVNKFGNLKYLKDNVAWRFCGGFFIGDINSINNFYDVSVQNFSDFLKQTQRLVWEVNYWSWLEHKGYINPLWYSADHDDSIIYIPINIL